MLEFLIVPARIVNGVGLFVVAAFGAFLAWRQSRTARTKLQLDLYDRRHPVYSATRELLAVLTAKGRPSVTDFEAFRSRTAEVNFLFGEDIASYIYEFGQVAQRRMLSGNGHAWPSQSDLAADMKWVSDQYGVIDLKFSPYLRLDERFSRFKPQVRRVPASQPRSH